MSFSWISKLIYVTHYHVVDTYFQPNILKNKMLINMNYYNARGLIYYLKLKMLTFFYVLFYWLVFRWIWYDIMARFYPTKSVKLQHKFETTFETILCIKSILILFLNNNNKQFFKHNFSLPRPKQKNSLQWLNYITVSSMDIRVVAFNLKLWCYSHDKVEWLWK